ncbi:ABC transporter substrate-binding protein [Thalassobacillus pellis]|uniref:ABC transporter substrate-binding protein n=1 Tax=Thalassobacillus pellis TaxID=748008 RepID=UPI0019608DBD|nr:sugar ABC transporter substrate-binding protein [Thalassobacillus pellis]
MYVLLSILLVVSLSLMGCNSGASTAEGGSSSDGKTKTINFVHWRGEDNEAFSHLIKKFEEKNPGIKVQMNIYSSNSYQSKIQPTLLSGKGADVFASFPGSRFSVLQKAGAYEDLSDQEFLNSFSENLLKAGQVDGKQLAVPFQLVYNQPVYNKGIFEELGLTPPDDWKGFLELCETLKKNGYIPLLWSGDISAGQFINPMVMNNQPTADALARIEKGEVKLTDEWFVKTLSQIKTLNDNGYLQENPLGTKKAGAASMLAQEKGAMLAHGSYIMATVKQQNPDIKLGLLAPITVPKDKAKYLGIHTATFMLGINKNSKYKEAAAKFIEFLTQPENASYYAKKTGQLLTLKEVEYDSPALKESAKWVEKETLFQPRYMITVPEVEQAIVTAVDDVIMGMDPEEAAKKAQEEVNRAIK